MKTFVTGATGYAGTHIATALRRAGHTVLGLTRDTSSPRARALAAAEIRPVAGDITDPGTYGRYLEEADAVVHTVLDMNDPVGTDKELFAELRGAQDRSGRTRHLIYTTGVSSYGRTGISLMDEETPGNPDSPLHFRMQLEAELADSGHPYTVIRPGFLYGAEARTSMTAQWFADGEAGRAVFYGDRAKRWTWVHVDDLATSYVAVLAHTEVADRQVFVIGDDHQPTALDVYTACLKAAGYTGEITFDTAEAGGMLQLAADQDELVTSAKARRILGWAPHRPGVLEDTATYHQAWRAARNV